MRVPWTEAKIDVTARCLEIGFSAEQLARHLSIEFQRHHTRSAVVGAVTRNRRLKAIGFARGINGAGIKPGRTLYQPRPIDDLGQRDCRFPITGSGDDTLYCGAPVADTDDLAPRHCICARHRRLVYRRGG